MKSGKHILLLTPGFAANEADDSCIPAMQVFLKTFSKLYPDYSLSIIAFHYPYSSVHYSWNGVDVFPCNGKNKSGISRLLTLRRSKSIARKLNKEKKFDVIHSFWLGECAQIGEILSKEFKIPHVNTLMGQDVSFPNRFLKMEMLKNVPTIALCQRHAEKFEKNTGRKTFALIPFGIEDDKISFAKERSIDLLAAGNLIELKRYSYLIEVVSLLKNEFPSLRVVVAGDGPQRPQLEKLAATLEVSHLINFVGQISRSKVLEWMQTIKILFHPSSSEGFGFVFVEARKFGMNIVSSPVGIASVSDHWKVAENIDQMVEAIRTFLCEKKEASSEIVYSASDTAEQYDILYSNLLKK